MNRGILLKSFKETWVPTVVLAAAALLAQMLLVSAISIFAKEMGDQWASVTFVRKIIQAILGTELGAGVGPSTFGAIVWVHPVMLAIVLTHALVTGSRLSAGETDRGTMDILATLPVSRWSLFVSDSFVSTCGGVVVLGALLCGNLLGMSLANDVLEFPRHAIFPTIANFLLLYLAAAGMVRVFAMSCEERGRAIGASLGVLISSLLLSFLAQFWSPAKALSFLSLLEYFRPLSIAENPAWPIADLASLLVFAVATWTISGIVFQRRDLHVV